MVRITHPTNTAAFNEKWGKRHATTQTSDRWQCRNQVAALLSWERRWISSLNSKGCPTCRLGLCGDRLELKYKSHFSTRRLCYRGYRVRSPCCAFHHLDQRAKIAAAGCHHLEMTATFTWLHIFTRLPASGHTWHRGGNAHHYTSAS